MDNKNIVKTQVVQSGKERAVKYASDQKVKKAAKHVIDKYRYDFKELAKH